MLYTLVGSERPRSFTSKKGVSYDVVDVQLRSNDIIPNGVGNYVLSLTVFSSTYPEFYEDILNHFNTGNEQSLKGKIVNLSYNQFGRVSAIAFNDTKDFKVYK